ncbi:CHAT domain-containing protein [Streptomyces sp. 3MP-14]|uniref:CHAT domain-containing protein n=1 Tax=Streptomyces mimosae TaxID=2586635 RepID=A0A5N6AE88_9ACTN|nr:MULTISPECIES: CHAT domain-containing protein [Streptomyces]KAB8166363.1 CHAT domain-containing protein [Streptomyces mimosae]KAB8174156.1 CHAT domain-containing protein [Streptomyces sp. 3MP-14]
MTDEPTARGASDANERQARVAAAVEEARRALGGTDHEGWPPPESLAPAIDQLTAVEAELSRHGENSNLVSVCLGIALGVRCLGAGADAAPEDRAQALRRLRWADAEGPLELRYVVEARMALVLLLVPWARSVLRGVRPALLDALLVTGDVRVVSESELRNLAEAARVLDRIARTPLAPAAARANEYLRRVFDRVLTAARPGTARAPAADALAADGLAANALAANALATDGLAADGPVVNRSATAAPEDTLRDAVRDLVTLAGACGIRPFTRVLVWFATWLDADASAGPGDEMGLPPGALLPLRRVAEAQRFDAGQIRDAAELALRALRELPAERAEARANIARLHGWLLAGAGTREPGLVDFNTVERPLADPYATSGNPFEAWPVGLAAEPGFVSHVNERGPDRVRDFLAHAGLRERGSAARRDLLLATLSGDPGFLHDAATLLSEALSAVSPDSWWFLSLGQQLANVLDRAGHDGSLRDAEASLALLRELSAALEREGSLAPEAPFALDIALSTADAELRHARRTGDHEALPGLARDLRARLAALPPDGERRDQVARRLAETAELIERPVEQRQASEQEITGLRFLGTATPHPMSGGPMDEAALRSMIAEARADLGRPTVHADHEYDRRAQLGLAQLFLALHGESDPAVLDDAIAELSRARALIGLGHGGPERVEVLIKLAEAHTLRSLRRGPEFPGDIASFWNVTREAMSELAVEVFLQSGTDHGLSVALNGALLSRRLAYPLAPSAPDQAVLALEDGRALVLQAIAASRTLPRLLDAAGHPELADRWRARTANGSAAPIPSGLRRAALSALGVRPRRGGEFTLARRLLRTATTRELTAGLAATGTDALVYLLPGQTAGAVIPGRALILRPGAEPRGLPLPELTLPGSPPLERYLDAAAARSRSLDDPAAGADGRAEAEERWRAALAALCDWAWGAAVGPVLAALGPTPRGRPPRIVLVPCGQLGVVPWHAARQPASDGGPGGPGAGTRARYACELAVFSYAPSGTQFLAAAARRRTPPAAGRQVLLADPELTLPWAEMEADALRAACYPAASRYGEFPAGDEPPDAAGTPEELLAALPGGANPAQLIHLACHALAAPRPTASALRLAQPPGAPPDAGRLTVSEILDTVAGGPADAPGEANAGPLIVLSACETDLSTRRHDEALTLATALVACGAADVVGSRWAVVDGATAVLMAVFHHHLTAGGLAPPDALRAAQLWMLDPHREPPPTLPDPLRREAGRPDLHRPHLWAAFTHQGNPRPAPAR